MPDPPFAIGIQGEIAVVIGRNVQPQGPWRRLRGPGKLLGLPSRDVSYKNRMHAIPGAIEDKSRGVVQPRIMSWILYPIGPQRIFFAGSGWNINTLTHAVLLA